jgi:hypothetical protein
MVRGLGEGTTTIRVEQASYPGVSAAHSMCVTDCSKHPCGGDDGCGGQCRATCPTGSIVCSAEPGTQCCSYAVIGANPAQDTPDGYYQWMCPVGWQQPDGTVKRVSCVPDWMAGRDPSEVPCYCGDDSRGLPASQFGSYCYRDGVNCHLGGCGWRSSYY